MNDGDILSWLHFGDLHVTTADQQNYHDFLKIVAEVNHQLVGRTQGIAFAVLPGDNADDGIHEQFGLVRTALDKLRLPIHVLPGDHDIKSGSLDDFYSYLANRPLPYSVKVRGYHCFFLNSVDTGKSKGFDFSPSQVTWLKQELRGACDAHSRPVLFMHTYPSELDSAASAIAELIRQYRVVFVDMGHTHYNEIANDGHTIYAATRSTGQIEEGPAGFSLTTIDSGVVSWKFKAIEDHWPFVIITSPADRHFIIDPTQSDQVVRGMVEVRAKVWGGSKIAKVTCQIDNSEPRTMRQCEHSNLWYWEWNSELVPDWPHELIVRAESISGSVAQDSITVIVNQSGHYQSHIRKKGDNVNAIGAHAAKGILGTQLGPNKNGRKW